MDDETKKSIKEHHKEHREDLYNWQPLNWRAWGSWFSWGSPIGLALFYAIVMLSTAGFIWILRQH
jgi:hypothetical protein